MPLTTPDTYLRDDLQTYKRRMALRSLGFRRGLAKVRAKTGRCTYLCTGDSTTGHFKGNGNRAAAHPAGIAARLNELGIPAVYESVCGSDAQTAAGDYVAYNPQVTLGANWGFDGAKPAMGGQIFRCDVNASAFGYTPLIPVDTYEFTIVQYLTAGTAAITIGGDAPATGPANISANANPTSIVRYKVTAAMASLAALAITKTNASAFFVVDLRAYNSAIPSVDVINAGWSGSNTAGWNSTTNPWSPINHLIAMAPDHVDINLGINDSNGGVALATSQANILAMITAAKSVGASVRLIGPLQSNYNAAGRASLATQNAMLDMLFNLSEANDCLYEEWGARDGGWQTAFNAGLMLDDLHGTPAANLAFGAHLVDSLISI